ncbi:hypothetical protein TRAPUB_2381 [Trametes pubescens]|uniref:Secreted protein n=1 Tax=Trametes pubescens TaxID=154538 RepID=A0A1M2VGP3_TRAPU|nr:hypothetical protein TRAPUB_2381 [Trametes pubescens]
MLWWMPLLVLFAWWTGKPFHLLFGTCPGAALSCQCGRGLMGSREDYFEVALLLGSCFLVNYVTADGKTNFAEATATWLYPGQPQVGFLLSCSRVVVIME